MSNERLFINASNDTESNPKHEGFEVSLKTLPTWYNIFNTVYDKQKYYCENHQLVYLLD